MSQANTTAAPRYTQADLDNAGEDARKLMAASPIIRSCVFVDIVTRRLYMTMRGVLDAEITEGWEVTNPELLIQTLTQSGQDKSNDKFTVIELQQSVLQSVVPFLDVLVRMEQDIEAAKTETNEETVDGNVSGNSDESPLDMEQLRDGAGSDTGDETRRGSEGDCGEAGEAGAGGSV